MDTVAVTVERTREAVRFETADGVTGTLFGLAVGKGFVPAPGVHPVLLLARIPENAKGAHQDLLLAADLLLSERSSGVSTGTVRFTGHRVSLATLQQHMGV